MPGARGANGLHTIVAMDTINYKRKVVLLGSYAGGIKRKTKYEKISPVKNESINFMVVNKIRSHFPPFQHILLYADQL